MYQIEKNIPIERMKKPFSYPFFKLNIGDSFFIPKVKGKELKETRRNVIASFRYYNKKKQLNWKIQTHIIEGGVRIWRTK